MLSLSPPERYHATIPVIETGAGVCHTYFDEFGDLEKGTAIINNAKTRRVSVCNALDCVIIHVVLLYDSKASKSTGTTKSNATQQKVRKVSGIVKDKNGESIIGASVKVKGEKVGTVTGIDGDFSLSVPGNATLVISYIGYVTQEVSIAGKESITVTLAEDVHSLNEVVVTAMSYE